MQMDSGGRKRDEIIPLFLEEWLLWVKIYDLVENLKLLSYDLWYELTADFISIKYSKTFIFHHCLPLFTSNHSQKRWNKDS